MSNVFLLSNSFVVSGIVSQLSYLIDRTIETIFVMEENHEDSDFENMNQKVVVCDDINYCIDNSDLVIIIRDNDFPEKTINYVMEKIDVTETQSLVLDNPWYNTFNRNNSIIEIDKSKIVNEKTPLVLIVSIGKATQEFETELYINQMLGEIGVSFCQIFAAPSYYLINELEDVGMLNCKIREAVYNCNKVCDLNVVTIKVDSTRNGFNDLASFLISFQPSFVVLQTEYTVELSNVETIIKSIIFEKPDIIIKSCFFEYKDGAFLKCSSKNETHNLIQLKSIKDKLLRKLSYPDNCKPI